MLTQSQWNIIRALVEKYFEGGNAKVQQYSHVESDLEAIKEFVLKYQPSSD